MTQTTVFVGCYTHRDPTAIAVYDASTPEGSLVELDRVTTIDHASFLVVHPHRDVLYAVSETANDAGDGGRIISLAIDPATRTLSELDTVTSAGNGPCHLAISPDGQSLWAANYLSGSAIRYALDDGGRIVGPPARFSFDGHGPSSRQEGPHTHGVNPTRLGVGQYTSAAYAVDLGVDTVALLAGDDDLAVVDELRLPPGTGPRHLAFDPDHRNGYLVGELNATLTHVVRDVSTATLTAHSVISTLPSDVEPNEAVDALAAEVRLHPNGRWVYVSTRGPDVIAVFDLDDAGTPRLVGHVPSGGQIPRSFDIHPNGKLAFVANAESDHVASFAIDPTTGMLEPTGLSVDIAEPVRVTIVSRP